jgi:V/A-type H+/Na+-transporting ATPase subunit E
MDINSVVLEIISESEKEAKRIEEDARKEREKLIDEAMERASKRKSEMDKESKKKISQSRIKEFAVARMNAKKTEMNAKKQALEDVYSKFSGKMDSGDEFLKKLLNAAGKEIEVSAVYVSKKDLERAKNLFKGIEIQESEISGGLVAENKEGSEKIDLSIDIIRESIRKETLSEVSKILFGGNK